MSNQVTCRNCGARNRVKATAPPGGLRPVCGRCGAPLGDDQPAVLNYDDAASPTDRQAENRRAIALIVITALALTGLAQLLLMILR